MRYQRAQLKLTAKRAMKESKSGPRLTTFLFLIVLGVSTWVVNMLLGVASGMTKLSAFYGEIAMKVSDPELALETFLRSVGPGRLIVAFLVGNVLSGFLTYLLSGLLNAGYKSYCLSVVRRQEPSMGAIFSGFSRIGSVVVTKILTWIFVFLWTLLFAVALTIVMAVLILLSALLQSEVMVVITALALLAGYVGVFVGITWVTLRYALVDFLIMDQGLSGMECIRESKRLMQGNVGRLFVLQLSFIGWYLLEFLIAFVGIIALCVIVAVWVVQTPELWGMSGSVNVAGMFGMLGGVLLIVLAVVIAVAIINIWLIPYITGSVAMFYEWTRGTVPTGPVIGPGGWGQPDPRQFKYTWSDGSGHSSGTGLGSGPQPDGDSSETVLDDGPGGDSGWGSGGWGGGQDGGSAPRPPRDDPWA